MLLVITVAISRGESSSSSNSKTVLQTPHVIIKPTQAGDFGFGDFSFSYDFHLL
jgi:hypothetical protein